MQHINKPTRARGNDKPHILDLVLTNEPIIDNIEFLAPLGKSDHSILNIHCNTQIRKIGYGFTLGVRAFEAWLYTFMSHKSH